MSSYSFVMKSLIMIAAAVLSLTAAASNALSADDEIVASGNQFDYYIPQHLEKGYSSILYSRKAKGDDTGKSALLLLTDKGFPNIALRKPWEATMLLFWDRDYGADGGIVSVGRRMVEDAEPEGRSGAYWKYLAPLGTLQRTYYLSFDPEIASGSESGALFYVKTLKSEPIEVAGIKKEAGVSCSLNSVHDGMSFSFGFSGSLCESRNYDLVHAAVTEMFRLWRKQRPENGDGG